MIKLKIFWLPILFGILLPQTEVLCGHMKYINDNCLVHSDYTIYPRCIITAFMNPKINCVDGSNEITFVENPGLSGVVFECTAAYPLEVEFNGDKPKENADIIVIADWRNETKEEYVLRYGFRTLGSSAGHAIVGQYTFYSTNNKSIQTSFYAYYDIAEQNKYPPPLLMFAQYGVNAVIYAQKSSTALEDYIIPCRPISDKTNVTLWKGGVQVNHPCLTFNPKVGFVCSRSAADIDNSNCTDIEKICNGNETMECRARNSRYEDQNLFIATEKGNKYSNCEKELVFQFNGTMAECYLSNYNRCDFYSPTINMVNIEARNPLEAKIKKKCQRKSTELCSDFDKSKRGKLIGCHTTSCSQVEKVFSNGLLICHFDGANVEMDYFVGLDKQIHDFANVEKLPMNTRLSVKVEDQANGTVLYFNQKYSFVCTSVIYGLSLPLLWYTKTNDEPFSLYETERSEIFAEGMDIMTIQHDFTILKNLTAIMCSARLWNSVEWFNTTFGISGAEGAIAPSFDVPNEELTLYVGEQRVFNCKVSQGLPTPVLQWRKNGKLITPDESISIPGQSEILTVNRVNISHAGTYTCTATNRVGTSTKTIDVKVEAQRPNSTGTIVGSTLTVFLICGGLAAGFLVRHYKAKMMLLSQKEYNNFLHGDPNAQINTVDNYALNAYNRDFEICSSDLLVDYDTKLGEGQFGIVFQGRFSNMDVAVKTTKENCEKQYLLALLSELKIMIYIGKHPHIAYLVGAVTDKIRKGEVFVVIELYPNGSLLNRLRNCHCLAERNSEKSITMLNHYGYVPETSDSVISKDELVMWSYQIANGMAFLETKNVVHGDLATRNVLLDINYHARISDFGLSRKIYEYGIYEKTSKEPLPWRWMSVEALRSMIFSSSSDVWSYGVTIWEIYSLGAMPYPGMSWSVDFLDKLSEGLRMGNPKHSNDKIYEIMTGCWQEDPERRISFAEVSSRLRELLEIPYGDADVYKIMELKEESNYEQLQLQPLD